LRHPLVLANMMSTIFDLTHGKAALGFATGGGTVLAIGHPSATQVQIRDHFTALRALFKGEPTIWDGNPVKALRLPRDVPIIYSAFGPKALQLAGAYADGAALFAGSRQMPELRRKIDAVRAAAQAAGRDPMSLRIWVTSYTSVRNTRKAALDDLKAFLIAGGMAIMWNAAVEAAVVPAHLKEKMREMVRRYDTTEHVVVGGRNSSLLDELGLADFLGDFDTTAGTPAEVKAALEEMASMGVDAFFIPLPGHADPEPTIEAVAQIHRQIH
jgi:5,10-methylenetetrahydromethanopterin reductase